MKVGIQIGKFDYLGGKSPDLGRLSKIAIEAERAGFDGIWVMDHFFQLEPHLGNAHDPMLEGYTTLAYMAAITKKVTLGTLVTGVIYREPGFLVKQVTTLDVLSGGRAWFGIGAGWYEREARGLGFEFGTVSERFEKLEETLQIAKQMWSGDESEFSGKHYKLEEPISSPQPIQKPHPPIMVGGEGEKKTLRMVAQYADACNLFAMEGVSHVEQKLKILEGHCKDLGRDYGEIEKTVMDIASIKEGNNSKKILEKYKEMKKAGVDCVIFVIDDYEKDGVLQEFGESVVKELHSL